MIDMTDRADIHMRLRPLKFRLSHLILVQIEQIELRPENTVSNHRHEAALQRTVMRSLVTPFRDVPP